MGRVAERAAVRVVERAAVRVVERVGRDQVVLRGDDGAALMVLCPVAVEEAALNLAEAREELAEHIRVSSDGLSRLWGYLPELRPEPVLYPQCRKLGETLAGQAVGQVCRPVAVESMSLAFIRLAVGRPESAVGGLHVDVHAGVGHTWPQEVPCDWHVLRLLFNLGPHPRKLQYCPLTVDTLKQRFGVGISRQEHQPLGLPGQPLQEVRIPPMEGGKLWCLRFVSSLVPHVGLTGDRGHFLASFGGYFPPSLLPMI